MALLGLFASPISGASMNPARDIIGAAIAVVIIILVRGRPVKEETEAAEGGDLPM